MHVKYSWQNLKQKRAIERPRTEHVDNIKSNTDVMYQCGLASPGSGQDSMEEFCKDGDKSLPSKRWWISEPQQES